jgi:hypothetical protein
MHPAEYYIGDESQCAPSRVLERSLVKPVSCKAATKRERSGTFERVRAAEMVMLWKQPGNQAINTRCRCTTQRSERHGSANFGQCCADTETRLSESATPIRHARATLSTSPHQREEHEGRWVNTKDSVRGSCRAAPRLSPRIPRFCKGLRPWILTGCTLPGLASGQAGAGRSRTAPASRMELPRPKRAAQASSVRE